MELIFTQLLVLSSRRYGGMCSIDFINRNFSMNLSSISIWYDESKLVSVIELNIWLSLS